MADYYILNNSTLEELKKEVERFYQWLNEEIRWAVKFLKSHEKSAESVQPRTKVRGLKMDFLQQADFCDAKGRAHALKCGAIVL